MLTTQIRTKMLEELIDGYEVIADHYRANFS